MASIRACDLRNDVSGILRRVEAGERLRVTVGGRPVADLVPLPLRPRFLPWEVLMEGADRWAADRRLGDELRELLPE